MQWDLLGKCRAQSPVECRWPCVEQKEWGKSRGGLENGSFLTTRLSNLRRALKRDEPVHDKKARRVGVGSRLLASNNGQLYKILETDNCNQDSVPQGQLVMWIQTRADRNISFLYKTGEKAMKNTWRVFIYTMNEIIILFETFTFQALFNTLTMYTSTQSGLICKSHLEFVVLPLFQIWGFFAYTKHWCEIGVFWNIPGFKAVESEIRTLP